MINSAYKVSWKPFGNIQYSKALSPTTHVAKHHGSTNKKLRCHLPLRVPKGTGADGHPPPCWLRVGSETVPLQEGVAIVFDDSFEHEAANDHSLEPRVVLVVDFWHPDFTDEEVLRRNSRYTHYRKYRTLKTHLISVDC
jgi:aspartyl/asparaginyl beta-hydroxylase (cupin superfamily)